MKSLTAKNLYFTLSMNLDEIWDMMMYRCVFKIFQVVFHRIRTDSDRFVALLVMMFRRMSMFCRLSGARLAPRTKSCMAVPQRGEVNGVNPLGFKMPEYEMPKMPTMEDCVGATPLVRLQRMVPAGSNSLVLCKLEGLYQCCCFWFSETLFLKDNRSLSKPD